MQINELINTKNIESSYKPLVLDKIAKQIICNYFNQIKAGEIVLVDESEVRVFGELIPSFPLKATINVQSSKMYLDIVAKGLNGFAESYIKGLWTCDNLTNLVRIFTRNRDVSNQFEGGIASLAVYFLKLSHSFRENNLQESIKNIHAHYDLGNDFFSTFLDETRMYSSAIFNKPETSLHEDSIT